jgi:hypothetical protein
MTELRTLIKRKGGFKTMDGDYQVDILNADIQMLYNGLGKLVRKIR